MKINHALRAVLLACLCYGISFSAHAVYRCEAQGKVTYTDAPCANGKTLEMDERSAPASADTTQAARQLAREKAELKRLEAARHKREAQDEKEQLKLARANHARRKKCAALAQKTKWSEEDAAQASGKSAGKTRIKARRMSEKYELECGR